MTTVRHRIGSMFGTSQNALDSPSDDEVALYGDQLAGLLTFVDELKGLDTEHVAATAQVIESRNVMRDDLPAPSLDRDEVLAQAPRAQAGIFRVLKIIAAAE